MKKLLILISFCLAVSGKLFSQINATLAGYPLVTTGWNIGGFGAVVDSEVRLTTPGTNENGYVYYNTAVNLTACAQFSIKFDYQIVPQAGTGVADGIAFFYIINPPSGFISGGGLGLPNPLTGMVFTLDTWDNDGDGLNPESEIYGYNTASTYNEGNVSQRVGPVHGLLNFMDDATWHHCEIDYNAGNISVYYDYSAVAGMTGYYLITIPTGYFGFSASTGAGFSRQSVKNVHIFAVGLATPPTVVSPVTYCQGATAVPLSATGTPGNIIRWFTTDTATVVALPGAPVPNTSAPGTTTYYVRQGNLPCMSAPDSIKVIVTPPPSAPVVTDPSPYCQGDTFIPFTETGVTGTVYWYSSAAGGAGVTTAPVVNTAVPGTYTYYFGQTTSGCTSPVDSVKILVNPAPLPIAGLSDVCQYLTTPLSDGTPGGAWTSGNTAVATINSTGVLNGLTAGTGTATTTITYKLPDGCYVTKNVNVHIKPVAPVVGLPDSICQAAMSVPLAVVPATGLVWYAPGGTIYTGGTPSPSTVIAGTDTFYVYDTSSYGCKSDTTTKFVKIIPLPLPPHTRDTMYCQGTVPASLTWQVDSAAGSQVNWYNSPSAGALGYVPAPQYVTPTYPGGTLWWVTQTVDGCVSSRAPVKVTIVYHPSFSIIPQRTWVCNHDSITFHYSGTYPLVDSAYLWQLPAGASFAGGSKATDSFIQVRFDTVEGQHDITLTVGELSGMCDSAVTIPVNVIALPAAHCYISPDICLGDTVALAISDRTPTAAIYEWDIDGIIMQSAPVVSVVAANADSGGPFSVAFTDSGIHVIEIKATTVEGCKSDPTFDTINVHSLPESSFAFAPKSGSTICLEDSILFTAYYQDNRSRYDWAPVHFFNNNNLPSIWGMVEQTRSLITLTVTDPFGCHSSSTLEIDPESCCAVAMPDAFTPGKLINNRFRPILSGFHRFHEFRILNRWGQTVFESADSYPQWDGTFNGVPQDMGTYYYYFSYDCGGRVLEQKGDCVLIR